MHDLMLSWCQCRKMDSRGRFPGEDLFITMRPLNSLPDAGEDVRWLDRLFEEVRSAGLHGLNGHGYVAIAGDHDCRQQMTRRAKGTQQDHAVHARQIGVD